MTLIFWESFRGLFVFMLNFPPDANAFGNLEMSVYLRVLPHPQPHTDSWWHMNPSKSLKRLELLPVAPSLLRPEGNVRAFYQQICQQFTLTTGCIYCLALRLASATARSREMLYPLRPHSSWVWQFPFHTPKRPWKKQAVLDTQPQLDPEVKKKLLG